MSDKFYLKLSTEEPEPGEPIGPTVTIAGIFRSPTVGSPLWMASIYRVPVPSWRHPIRRLKALRWNKRHEAAQYHGYSVGIRR